MTLVQETLKVAEEALLSLSSNESAILIGLAGISSVIATILLFLISYEKMLRDEYAKFYKRYLVARGFFEEKIDKFVDSIL